MLVDLESFSRKINILVDGWQDQPQVTLFQAPMKQSEIAVTLSLAATEDVNVARQKLHAVHFAIMAKFAKTNTLFMKKRIRIGNRIRKKGVRKGMKPVTRIEVAEELWSPR